MSNDKLSLWAGEMEELIRKMVNDAPIAGLGEFWQHRYYYAAKELLRRMDRDD